MPFDRGGCVDPAHGRARSPPEPGERADRRGVSPVGVCAGLLRGDDAGHGPGQNEPSVTGVAGPSALIMAISWAGSGRWAGSFFRQASMTWRSLGGIALRSGSAETIRYRIDAGLSPPKGGLPVAA